jgi:hypothetical protein
MQISFEKRHHLFAVLCGLQTKPVRRHLTGHMITVEASPERLLAVLPMDQAKVKVGRVHRCRFFLPSIRLT